MPRTELTKKVINDIKLNYNLVKLLEMASEKTGVDFSLSYIHNKLNIKIVFDLGKHQEVLNLRFHTTSKKKILLFFKTMNEIAAEEGVLDKDYKISFNTDCLKELLEGEKA